MAITSSNPVEKWKSPYSLQEGAEANLGSVNRFVGDTLSGESYAPTANAMREGTLRLEATQRNALAGSIYRAGGSGTPLAAGAGYGLEQNLMRNRFDNAINIDQAKQESMMKGADMAQNMASNVNRFYKEGAEARETVEGIAGTKAASIYEARRQEIDKAMKSATTLTELSRYAPDFVAAMQQKYTADGGLGEVSLEYIKGQHQSLSNPAYRNNFVMLANDISEAFPEWHKDTVRALVEKVMLGDLVYDSNTNKFIAPKGGTIPGGG